MAIERERQRNLLVRRTARKFAEMVRDSGMAHKVPDEIIDWLTDEEIEPFKEYLRCFGLVQRKDWFWEHERNR